MVNYAQSTGAKNNVHTITYNDQQSPREIKRREVSWTLMKKLGAFAGPREIKRREVSWTLMKKLDPQVSPQEIKSKEVELGLKVELLLL